jgi:cyclic lactone autoinducer peptide
MTIINKIALGFAGICATALVFLAEISVSAGSVIFWHEPDCPEELLKK